MAIIKNVSYSGQGGVSTLGGQIRLEEATGRLVVYDARSNRERTIFSVNGTQINDANGNEMTRLDTRGLTTIEASTGMYKNRVGIAGDGRSGMWSSKPGEDLRDLIGG